MYCFETTWRLQHLGQLIDRTSVSEPELVDNKIVTQANGNPLAIQELVSQVQREENLTPASIRGYDCVLISTDHSVYDYETIVKNAKLVVDTRNACAKVKGSKKNVFMA